MFVVREMIKMNWIIFICYDFSWGLKLRHVLVVSSGAVLVKTLFLKSNVASEMMDRNYIHKIFSFGHKVWKHTDIGGMGELFLFQSLPIILLRRASWRTSKDNMIFGTRLRRLSLCDLSSIELNLMFNIYRSILRFNFSFFNKFKCLYMYKY